MPGQFSRVLTISLIASALAALTIGLVGATPARALTKDFDFGRHGKAQLDLPRGTKLGDVSQCKTSANGGTTVIGAFSTRRDGIPHHDPDRLTRFARVSGRGRAAKLAGGKRWSGFKVPKGHILLTDTAIDTQGGVLYAYMRNTKGGERRPVLISRMTPRGQFDRGFGVRGRATAPPTRGSSPSLDVLRDGRIAWAVESDTEYQIALFSSRGKSISGFADDGVLTGGPASTIAAQSGLDGSILVSLNSIGFRTAAGTLSQFDRRGEPVLAFGNHGVITYPVVPSVISPSVNRPFLGTAIFQSQNGHVVSLGQVADDRIFPDFTSEFEELDPSSPQASEPVWRSPKVDFFPNPGDSGGSEYFDVDSGYRSGMLFYARVQSWFDSDGLSGDVSFSRVAPGSTALDITEEWRVDGGSFMPEAVSWSRDTESLIVCGATLKRSMPTKIVLQRLDL